MNDKEKIAYLEATVADRERRIFNLASIIRAMVKAGAKMPSDPRVDYSITPEESRTLGITNWKAAIQ
jgi:predicted DNA-binding ribbon-helix-helix protein